MSERRFVFWVDGVQFDHTVHTISGAQIRAMVPRLESYYHLWMEGIGDEPDQKIDHMTSVSIEANSARFYTVPPTIGG